jgi:hypothetical protein
MLSAERGEVEGLYTDYIHAKQLLLATCALGATEARRSIPPGAAHTPCVTAHAPRTALQLQPPTGPSPYQQLESRPYPPPISRSDTGTCLRRCPCHLSLA